MIEKSLASNFWPSFHEPLRSFGSKLAEWIAPASEASSDDKVYRIAIELPGVEEKDLDLEVREGVLTVKGEKRTSREEKGETWYFSERQFGAFSRSFRLPADADEEAVKAEMKDGIVTITVPKKSEEASAKQRKIQISRG